jgi:hypothetical protein
MAKPSAAQTTVPTKPEPETVAYALVKVSPGLWSARKMLTRGAEILAYEDSDADTRSASIGRVIRMLERAN